MRTDFLSLLSQAYPNPFPIYFILFTKKVLGHGLTPILFYQELPMMTLPLLIRGGIGSPLRSWEQFPEPYLQWMGFVSRFGHPPLSPFI